jgi:hypothetical protein
LTADEEISLKTADREYSKANYAVWDAEEAVYKKMPGAEEALTLAKEKKRTAFFSKMDFRGSLQIKYTGCFTCQVGSSNRQNSDSDYTERGDLGFSGRRES